MLLWTLGFICCFELYFLFIFPDIYPGVELLACVVVLFLVFWESCILLPQWLHRITFSPTVYKGSLFWTLSLAFIFVLFDDSHSDKYEVISHFGFDLHFLDDWPYWVSFHVPVGHLHVLFGKMSIQVFCSLFNCCLFLFVCVSFFFFWCWVVWTVYIFWILIPYQF